MEREPTRDDDHGTPAVEGPDVSEPGHARIRPRIDVSPALHEAGHEVADLGYEGVPDDGPVLHSDDGPTGPADPLDFVNVQILSD